MPPAVTLSMLTLSGSVTTPNQALSLAKAVPLMLTGISCGLHPSVIAIPEVMLLLAKAPLLNAIIKIKITTTEPTIIQGMAMLPCFCFIFPPPQGFCLPILGHCWHNEQHQQPNYP